MSKNLQIQVAAPCSENWEDMSPSEEGRFCSSCRKTVVDFSVMSDREVLNWLMRSNRSDADTKVCGRFSAHQVNRNLLPPPERSRRWRRIWNFLLAGLLVSSKAPAQTTAARTPVSQYDKRLLGTPAIKKTPGESQTIGNPSGEPAVGKMAIEPLALAKIPVAADTPKYSVLPPVVVRGYGTIHCHDIMGDVVVVGMMGLRGTKTTILKDLVKDTLAIMGFSKKELTLYPNPAPRGTVVKLSWQPDLLGEYKLELFNGNGALLQEKVVLWTNESQTESLNIPASVPAGIYFVKLSHPGTGKVYTRKMMVL